MKKGFFASLFNFSFRSFITTKIIPVFYILTTILLGLFTLVFLIVSVFGLVRGGGLGSLFGLIAAPLYFLLGIIAVRVFLEAIIVLHRIEGNTARIAGARPAPGTDAGPSSGSSLQ